MLEDITLKNKDVYEKLIDMSEKLGNLSNLPDSIKEVGHRIERLEDKHNETNIKLLNLKHSVDNISLSRLAYNFIRHVKFWSNGNNGNGKGK